MDALGCTSKLPNTQKGLSMATQKLPSLTPVEWDLMNEIWRHRGATVADVHALFVGKRGWNHNTVKTMMQRLIKKGYLRRETSQRAHFYSPAVERSRVTARALGDTLDRILENGFGPLVAYAADRKNLSREEVAKLREILEGETNA
jgi:BlaI family transcriptional regulator, penicillinase repressor